MKRYPTYHLAMAAIAAMTVALFSCNDDEDPVIPVVSFQAAAKTVGEDAGTIDVVLQLDVDAPREIKVRYTLSGTASEGTTTSSDFQVLANYGEVTIAEGSSTGTLQLQIKDDGAVEVDETVIITINDVVNDAATLGATPATTITIQSNDLGAKVAFTSTTTTVNETARAIEIALTLDKAAGQDLTVDYEFNYELGDDVSVALDSVKAFEDDIPARYYDFYVESNTFGKLTIPAGATTAKITLFIYSDINLEDDETIEMNLKAVSTGGQLGTNTKHTIKVEQEDGRAIGVFWNNAAYTDVDMDLFLWFGEDVGTLEDVLFASAEGSVTNKLELLFIPKIISDDIADAAFGLSFVYYAGSASPMTFNVAHADFKAGALEPEAGIERFTGTYTTANINKWDDATSGKDPQIEQTFVLTAGAYGTPSAITVPSAGSRQASHELPANVVKEKMSARAAFSKHLASSAVRQLIRK